MSIQTEVTKETLLHTIRSELAGMNLTTNEYIQLANAILDAAIEKKQSNGAADGWHETEAITALPARSGDIIIRSFNQKNDIPLLKKWTEDTAGKEFLLSRVENSSPGVEQLVENKNNHFGIVCNPQEEPIGIVGFLNYDKKQKKAELRKLIGEKAMRGLGFGKKAARLWISYGIHALQLRKIYLYTFDTNLRNIRINEDLGFKLEGIYRAENIINNVPKDIIRMGLLIGDPPKSSADK